MLTTTAALLTTTRLVFIALILLLTLALPLSDPDYFWHLKAGEYIVSHRALPDGDVFSFTRFGHPWVLHEWLFEVVLFAAFAMLGALGVKLLAALFASAALGVTFMLVRRIAPSPAAAFILLICTSIPFAGAVAPRPQLVTYLFFALFLSILLNYKYHRTRRALFVLPLLMVVWVNAHGGYVIGIALIGLFTVTEWLNYRLGTARDPAQRQHLVRLTQVAAATALASLLNPGFIEHWLYPFQVLGMEANQWIEEWQSPNFRDLGSRGYLLLCILLMLSYTYADRKPDMSELLIPGFFLVNGFIAVRHIPIAALTVVPFIALALSRGCTAACAAKWNASPLARKCARAVSGGKQLGQGEVVLNWILLIVIVIVLSLYQPLFRAHEMRQAEMLPSAAANYVIANRIQGNMFNAYDAGGYLIYRLAPDRKVVIDGRVDVYGDKFFADYRDMYMGKASWREKFDKLAIDFVIIENDAPLRQLLLADGSFNAVYRDKRHSVLLRSIPRQPTLLSKSGNQGE
jgi:hypothetical protein